MWPAGAVEGHLHQSFIEGRHKVTKAVDAAAISEGLPKRLAQGDAHVLIGVVIVDMGVTSGTDRQIKEPMARQLMKHVIEEGHASAHLALATAIKTDGHTNLGFPGDAMDVSLPAHVRSLFTPC